MAPAPGPEHPLEPTTPLPPSTAGLRTPDGSTLEVGAMVAGRYRHRPLHRPGRHGRGVRGRGHSAPHARGAEDLRRESLADTSARWSASGARCCSPGGSPTPTSAEISSSTTPSTRGRRRRSFLTMELLDGDTLARRLPGPGRLAHRRNLRSRAASCATGSRPCTCRGRGAPGLQARRTSSWSSAAATSGLAPLRAVITDFGIARALTGWRRDGAHRGRAGGLHRDPGVHGAGAGDRGRHARRPPTLRAGSGPVRGAHRPHSLRRSDADGGRAQAAPAGCHPAVRPPADPRAPLGRGNPPLPGEGAVGPLPVGARI